MRIKNDRFIVMLLVILLGFSAMAYALTNEERLQLLEDKYLKGEIPTEVYLKLQKKYTAGKETPVQTPAQPKPAVVKNNLLQNPGFEEEMESGFPKGWSKYEQWKNSYWKPHLSLDTAEKHSGAQSLKFKVTSASVGGVKQKVPVKVGKTYIFSFWAKSQNLQRKSDGAPIIYNVQFLDADGKRVAGGYGKEVRRLEGSKDWMNIKQEGLAPAGATQAQVIIFNYVCRGTAWIDDCSFTDKSSKYAEGEETTVQTPVKSKATTIPSGAKSLKLNRGCYKIDIPADDGCGKGQLDKVLIDGGKKTSYHEGVARWWGKSKVEVTFDLGSERKISGVKVYTTINKDQRIKAITVSGSLDGQTYKGITDKENPDKDIIYPKSQVIEIGFEAASYRYVKFIIEKDPKYSGFQVSEVEIF